MDNLERDALYRFRQIAWAAGLGSGLLTLAGLCLGHRNCAAVGTLLLGADGLALAVKNRCPFCRKALRLRPLRGEEHCPFCGTKLHEGAPGGDT